VTGFRVFSGQSAEDAEGNRRWHSICT